MVTTFDFLHFTWSGGYSRGAEVSFVPLGTGLALTSPYSSAPEESGDFPPLLLGRSHLRQRSLIRMATAALRLAVD